MSVFRWARKLVALLLLVTVMKFDWQAIVLVLCAVEILTHDDESVVAEQAAKEEAAKEEAAKMASLCANHEAVLASQRANHEAVLASLCAKHAAKVDALRADICKLHGELAEVLADNVRVHVELVKMSEATVRLRRCM